LQKELSKKRSAALHSFCGHAVSAHEQALIDQLSNALTDLGLCKPHEHAHGPWLVHTASVATDLMITTNTLQGECSIKDFGTEPPHHRASQLSRCL
jgi:hypothetical protein